MEFKLLFYCKSDLKSTIPGIADTIQDTIGLRPCKYHLYRQYLDSYNNDDKAICVLLDDWL